MRVFGSGLSPYVQRVMLAARHKRVELIVEPLPDGSRSEAHLARNPMGKVPVLQHGELLLPESEVIVGYLEDCVAEPSLFSGDAAARAHVRLLVRVLDSYGPRSFRPFLDNDADGIADALQKITASLGYLERLWQPTGGAHATGAAFSAADCALLPFFTIYEMLPPALGVMQQVEAHPQVAAWWQQARTSESGQFTAATLQAAVSAVLSPPAAP